MRPTGATAGQDLEKRALSRQRGIACVREDQRRKLRCHETGVRIKLSPQFVERFSRFPRLWGPGLKKTSHPSEPPRSGSAVPSTAGLRRAA